MSRSPARILTAFAVGFAAFPQFAAALTCSTLEASSQVANINEIRKGGDNSATSSLPDEFVELRMFSAVSTTGWTLCYFKHPSETCISAPSTPYPYPYSESLPVNPSIGEVILRDASGGVLDHLRYSNNGSCSSHWSVPAACSSGCVTSPSGDKDLARSPDGTGAWAPNDDGNTAGSNNGGGATLNHIRVLHDGSGLTCNAETVTLVACADASCSSYYTDSVSVTPLATAGIGASFSPAAVTFSGGSTTVSLRATSAGSTTLGANVTSPAASSSTRCFIGASESCLMTFAASGLLVDVPDHVSDTPTDFTVAAVRSSDNALQCVPAFANVTRSISFYSGYANPATGTLAVSVEGSSIAGSSPGTAISLDFDATGTATASLRYADVGELSLHAAYTGSAGVGDSGLSLVGSDNFVVRPADFVLDIAGNPGVATPAGAAGEVFRKAGQPFTVAVTARNASGVATPNFGLETPAEAVRLETTLVAPVGGNAPDLVASSGFAGFSAGVASGDWVWDEVGAISLRPRLDDADYLGSGDVIGIDSGTVGRFVPDHLQLSPGVLSVQPACAGGGFSYFGQAFGFATGSEPSLTISAHSASSGYPITGNYENEFWRLAGGWAGRRYLETSADPDVELSLDSSAAAMQVSGEVAPAFDGTQNWRMVGDRVLQPRAATPVAPLDAQLSFELLASDLTDQDGVCYDGDHDGGCDAYSLPASATLPLRWGRLAVDNAFGPELFDLQVPARAEYFNGTLFVSHAADSCTAIDALSLADANPADTLAVADTCVQDTGQPGSSGIGCAAAGPPLRQFQSTAVAGQWNIWLKAPGAGRTGELDLGATVPAYLHYDWTGSGAAAPTARISFGVFAGEREQIYQRELY